MERHIITQDGEVPTYHNQTNTMPRFGWTLDGYGWILAGALIVAIAGGIHIGIHRIAS